MDKPRDRSGTELLYERFSGYQKRVDAWFVEQQKTNEHFTYWSNGEICAQLGEEGGEFSREIRNRYGSKPKRLDQLKQTPEDELGDVIYAICCFANKNKIDIELLSPAEPALPVTNNPIQHALRLGYRIGLLQQAIEQLFDHEEPLGDSGTIKQLLAHILVELRECAEVTHSDFDQAFEKQMDKVQGRDRHRFDPKA